MSYNLKAIIEKNKEKIVIKEDNTKLIAWLLGQVIADDILSITCECKRTWDSYDRLQAEEAICKELKIENKNPRQGWWNKSHPKYILLPKINKLSSISIWDICGAQ